MAFQAVPSLLSYIVVLLLSLPTTLIPSPTFFAEIFPCLFAALSYTIRFAEDSSLYEQTYAHSVINSRLYEDDYSNGMTREVDAKKILPASLSPSSKTLWQLIQRSNHVDITSVLSSFFQHSFNNCNTDEMEIREEKRRLAMLIVPAFSRCFQNVEDDTRKEMIMMILDLVNHGTFYFFSHSF